MNEPNGVKASSAAGTVAWWASVEATIEVTHWPQPPKTGPPPPAVHTHQYGLLSSHDKSQASFCFIWRHVICWCDKYVTVCDGLCHNLMEKTLPGKQVVKRTGAQSVQPNNLENTGIFVFSRVCPCVCRKQTNKHGLSSLSVKQRFQDLVRISIKLTEKDFRV